MVLNVGVINIRWVPRWHNIRSTITRRYGLRGNLSLRLYICLELHHNCLYVLDETTGAQIDFKKFPAFNTHPSPHISICYQSKFSTYESWHKWVMVHEALFSIWKLNKKDIWGQLRLSPDGHQLRLGHRSEMYGILRFMQPSDNIGHNNLHISLQ